MSSLNTHVNQDGIVLVIVLGSMAFFEFMVIHTIIDFLRLMLELLR